MLSTGGNLCTLEVAILCSLEGSNFVFGLVWCGVIFYGGGSSISNGGDA